MPPRHLALVLTWSTIYQISMALITALLAVAARHLTDPANLVYVILLFAVVAQLPNLVEIPLRSIERPGYYDIFRKYLNERLIMNFGQTEVWSSRQQREVFLTAIGPDVESNLTLLTST